MHKYTNKNIKFLCFTSTYISKPTICFYVSLPIPLPSGLPLRLAARSWADAAEGDAHPAIWARVIAPRQDMRRRSGTDPAELRSVRSSKQTYENICFERKNVEEFISFRPIVWCAMFVLFRPSDRRWRQFWAGPRPSRGSVSPRATPRWPWRPRCFSSESSLPYGGRKGWTCFFWNLEDDILGILQPCFKRNVRHSNCNVSTGWRGVHDGSCMCWRVLKTTRLEKYFFVSMCQSVTILDSDSNNWVTDPDPKLIYIHWLSPWHFGTFAGFPNVFRRPGHFITFYETVGFHQGNFNWAWPSVT